MCSRHRDFHVLETRSVKKCRLLLTVVVATTTFDIILLCTNTLQTITNSVKLVQQCFINYLSLFLGALQLKIGSVDQFLCCDYYLMFMPKLIPSHLNNYTLQEKKEMYMYIHIS